MCVQNETKIEIICCDVFFYLSISPKRINVGYIYIQTQVRTKFIRLFFCYGWKNYLFTLLMWEIRFSLSISFSMQNPKRKRAPLGGRSKASLAPVGKRNFRKMKPRCIVNLFLIAPFRTWLNAHFPCYCSTHPPTLHTVAI
jgi:hypothetical protein